MTTNIIDLFHIADIMIRELRCFTTVYGMSLNH